MENRMEFKTKIVNHRAEQFPVYESNGERLVVIAAKGWTTLVSESPLTTYAPFRQIDIFKDHVELDRRPDWTEPERGAWVLSLLNLHGEDIEQRLAGGALIYLPRGVPVNASLQLTDPLIFFSTLTVKKVWERRKDPNYPGYFVRVATVEDQLTQRPETELFSILGLMEEAGIEPPELPPEPEKGGEEAVFECLFENKTDAARTVFADSGRAFFSIAPKKSLIVESYSPEAIYARYKKIIFKKDDKIDLEINKRWRCPYPLSVELINEEGAPIEAVTLAGRSWNVIRGIPRYAEVRLDDADVFYKTFTWRREKVKKVRPTLPGYYEEEEHVTILKEPRAEKEIEALREQRKAKLMGRQR